MKYTRLIDGTPVEYRNGGYYPTTEADAALPTEAAELRRVLGLLREKFTSLLDVADDLRCYTRDWDWKYGEYWDGEIESARAALAAAEKLR